MNLQDLQTAIASAIGQCAVQIRLRSTGAIELSHSDSNRLNEIGRAVIGAIRASGRDYWEVPISRASALCGQSIGWTLTIQVDLTPEERYLSHMGLCPWQIPAAKSQAI